MHIALEDALKSFIGGDLEYIDAGAGGSMYRGPITAMREIDHGAMIEVTLGWCARKMLFAGASWERCEIAKIVFSKDDMVLEAGEYGKITFDFLQLIVGTFYPKGQNLPAKQVRGFGPIH
jgi:hypothetical protein